MDWNSDIIKNLKWQGTISNQESKQKVAEQIASKVVNGDVIGVGSGSTSYLAVLAIAQRIKSEKLHIKAIPSSVEIALTCSKMDIPITNLYENRPDWYFDGADEVDPNKHLIKGRGGAMFKEKLIMSASEIYVYTTYSKKHSDDLDMEMVSTGYLDHISKKLKFVGDLSAEQIERLKEIAGKCPVHRTLKAEIIIETSVIN